MTNRCVVSRRRRWLMAAGAALAWIASAPGPLPAGGPREEAVRWPENVHLVQASLTREGFLATRGRRLASGQEVLDLPQLRAYDRLGRRLLALEGFDRSTFTEQVAPLLTRRAKPLPGPALIADLEKLEAHDGGPIQGLPASHLTLVTWTLQGSSSSREQSRELAVLLALVPDLRINLIQVDYAPERFEPPPRTAAEYWAWPAWPANVRKIPAELTPKTLAGFYGLVPQLRIFDRAGRQIFTSDTRDKPFARPYQSEISAVLLGRVRPVAGAPSVDAELALIQTPAGGKVPRLPPADLTMVFYWSERGGQGMAQDLARRFAAQPWLRANLLFVEADRNKRLTAQR
jgi:hypothetical protein